MPHRCRTALGVLIALTVIACQDDESEGRPTAEPGRVVTVVDRDLFGGSGMAGPTAIDIAPDGTIYAVDSLAETVEGEEGLLSSLLAFPARGPARVVAGISPAIYRGVAVKPEEAVDPFPRLRTRGLNLRAVVIGPDGTIFVIDGNNHAVYGLGPDGKARIVAGTGEKASSGDGGPAVQAALDGPVALAVNPRTGELFIAGQDRRVRRVDPAGTITTVAGDGARGFGGDGGPAARAQLVEVDEMAVDARSGDLYLCDASLIRKVDRAGTITRIAGMADGDGSADPALRAAPDTPVDCSGLAVDPRDGVLYFSDSKANQIRRVTPFRGG